MKNYKELFEKFCQQSRMSGTDFNQEISSFLTIELKKMGYIVEQQEHPFVGWELLEKPILNLTSPINHQAECIAMVRSGSTDGKQIKGKILSFFSTMKTFEAYDFQKFSIVDDNNKVIGVILTRPDMVWAQPIDEIGEHLPHIIVDRETCGMINQFIASNQEVLIDFSITTKYLPNKKITNVIAKKSKDSNLIVSAHYDSFYNTVGAHDNASGAISLLSLANKFKNNDNINPTFCFFDAEEWNKLGAYSFVNISDNINSIDLQINIDSVGVPDSLYMLTNPKIESIIQKNVSKLSTDISIDVNSKKELPQFDIWPFMQKGINVIQIGSRSETNPFKYWHSEKDNLDNIDYIFLEKTVDVLEEFILSLSIKEIK